MRATFHDDEPTTPRAPDAPLTPTYSRGLPARPGSAPRSLVHDIYSSPRHSPHAVFDDTFRNTLESPKLHEQPRVPTISTPLTGDALKTPGQPSNRSDSSRPAGVSRRRSYWNATSRGSSNFSKAFQAHQPEVTHYPSLQDRSTLQPSYPGQSVSSDSSYVQHGPYPGGQYTTTSPSPVTGVAHQQLALRYTYPSHPGLLTHDSGVLSQHGIGYSANMLMPPTPAYSYPAHFPKGYSSSGYSSGNNSTTTPGLYASAPSPLLHLTQSQPMSPPYSTSSSYPPLYALPSYPYPPHLSEHTRTSPYLGQLSYGQQYQPAMTAPTEQEPGGAWWYLPPGTCPAPSQHYNAYVNLYPPIRGALAPHEVQAHASENQSGLSAPSANSWSTSPTHRVPLSPFVVSPLPSHPRMQRQPSPEPPLPLADVSSRTESALTRPEQLPAPVKSSRGERMHIRKPHHPNPPSNRSEWVMWAGNVPRDATHDELLHFFNRSPFPSSAGSLHSRSDASDSCTSFSSIHGDVASVHLISRSNCAFINFQTITQLTAAVEHFNGQRLRPYDIECPRLVCRVRAREDDLKAGVGGQRGTGVHVRMVKDRMRQERALAAVSLGQPECLASSDDLVPTIPVSSLSSDDEVVHECRNKRPPAARHTSSSSSYASTNSSLLSQHFPQRYFILKSLTQFDLDLSVETGLWATQRHNEDILDQARRTSEDVYLIFGVNKSREFYGYARMTGPVLHYDDEPHEGHQQVPWASRSSLDSPPAYHTLSHAASPRSDYTSYLPPNQGRIVNRSPLSTETPETSYLLQQRPKAASAPPIMQGEHDPLSSDFEGQLRHGRLSFRSPSALAASPTTTGYRRQLEEDIRLDPFAPPRDAKHPEALDLSFDEAEECLRRSPSDAMSNRHEGPVDPKAGDNPAWGGSFRVEWLRTDRLGFQQTRHLRNPWNHDREVKVSRDGTELDPSIGQALLEEWDKPKAPEPPSH